MDLVSVAAELRDAVAPLRFGPPVSHVYNPLDYAWDTHRSYLERSGQPPKEVILLGMNPGPWGMAQTGVPFGEAAAVRQWLGIEGRVGRPDPEHPKRPVAGLGCTRSEVSGRRLWGWARDTFGDPERFHARFFVANYCPLLFLEAGGRNLTPDRLRAGERRALEQVCDRALRDTVRILRPEIVVGVGAFAARRAERVLGDAGVRIGQVLHPSTASPAANRGWSDQMTDGLERLGIDLG